MESNTEKTIKNSVIIFFAQIISFILTFINRKVFLAFLSIEYLGYQSLFGNVFTILSVAELGIGQVISYQLYKEIVQANNEEIGKLMTVYKAVYRIVAVIVLAMGLVCYFFLPYIIKETSLEWSFVTLIYFIQLLSVFAGYFLSYRRVIFIASQQEYKCVVTDTFVLVITQLVQLLFLFLFRKYLVYLIINLSTSLVQNFIIYRKTTKEYPILKKKIAITREYIRNRHFFKDVGNMIVHRISYTIYDGTDSIVISSFLGISYVGLYGNYYTLYSHIIRQLVSKILNPIQATLGNIIYSDRKLDELWDQFNTFDLFSFFFASQIAIGFLVFFQPFIQFWFGSEYLLPDSFVILFVITIYLGLVWEIVYKYRAVFGDFHKDCIYMVLSAILNVTISIIAVQKWGITGIQFGTLVAFFPIAFGRIHFVIKGFFHFSLSAYLRKHFLWFLLFAMESTITYLISMQLPVSFFYLLIRGLIWMIVPLLINGIVFFKSHYFKKLMEYFKIAKRIIRKERGAIQ